MNQILTTKEVNQKIRLALIKAAKNQQDIKPFNLSGRGHEPRVALDRKLAGILRGLDLPCTYISGFGANLYYPKRVFELALKRLKRQLGYAPFAFYSTYSVYRKDDPPVKGLGTDNVDVILKQVVNNSYRVRIHRTFRPDLVSNGNVSLYLFKRGRKYRLKLECFSGDFHGKQTQVWELIKGIEGPEEAATNINRLNRQFDLGIAWEEVIRVVSIEDPELVIYLNQQLQSGD